MSADLTAVLGTRSAPCSPDDTAGRSDAQLLASFFRSHDDEAFAAILSRYGPLVYGVCGRILSDTNDVEDAFQATFLVLVKKGDRLREPERLGNWLYGVAYRAARKVQAKAVRHGKVQWQVAQIPPTSEFDDLTYAHLRTILDEEISHLPEKYALPLVLCYLEGKTNAEAAAQLGWPEGSMSRRLSRARELLRSRLARRGLALTAALIAAVFARPAVAAIPPQLAASTLHAVTLVAQGVALQDVVSPGIATLVGYSLAMPALRRWTIAAVVAVVAALIITLTVTVGQIGGSVYGANSAFHQDLSPHALVTSTESGNHALSIGNEARGITHQSQVPVSAPSGCATR